MTVVVHDDGGSEEVADAVVDVAEAVADAIVDAVEDVVDAVEDGGGGGHSDAEIDRWVATESRLSGIESRLDDLASRPAVSYQEVEEIVRNNVVATAAVVAEEVAEEVVDEAGDLEDGTPDEITIVTPDVDETHQRPSLLHRIW